MLGSDIHNGKEIPDIHTCTSKVSFIEHLVTLCGILLRMAQKNQAQNSFY